MNPRYDFIARIGLAAIGFPYGERSPSEGIAAITTDVKTPKSNINPIPINPTIAKNMHHLALSLKAETANSFNDNFSSIINKGFFWLVIKKGC